ncbi:MAG: GNAT family N-acetyltransferase [Anaerolineales bacterium]|nr:GNAT family N-acetyltransferase [Anaerolineales bacterium]
MSWQEAGGGDPATSCIIDVVMTDKLKIPIIIRQARPEDAERLAELATQLGYPSTTQQVMERFAIISGDEGHAVFAAEKAGQVLGWVHVYLHSLLICDREAEITSLVVDESQHGAGIGRVLVQAAEGWAREHDCDHICVPCNVIRSKTHEFYRRMGYDIMKTQHYFRKKMT